MQLKQKRNALFTVHLQFSSHRLANLSLSGFWQLGDDVWNGIELWRRSRSIRS